MKDSGRALGIDPKTISSDLHLTYSFLVSLLKISVLIIEWVSKDVSLP